MLKGRESLEMSTALAVLFGLICVYNVWINGRALIAFSEAAEGMSEEELAEFRALTKERTEYHLSMLWGAPFFAFFAHYFYASESVAVTDVIGVLVAFFGWGALVQSFRAQNTKALTHRLAERDSVKPISSTSARVGESPRVL